MQAQKRIPKKKEKVHLKHDSSNLYRVIDFDAATEIVVVKKADSRKDPYINVDLNDIVFFEKEKLTGFEKNQILDKWVESAFMPNIQSRVLQLSILNKLMVQYPDLDFWRNFEPEFKVKNFLWYLGDGAEKIKLWYLLSTKSLTSLEPAVKLEPVKIGNDLELQRKIHRTIDLFKNVHNHHSKKEQE